MNFDLPGILQLILTIVGIIGFIAIASTFFIVRRYSEVLKINESTIKAYKESSESKDHELKELRTEVKELTGKLAGIEGEVKVLRTIPLAEMTASLADISKTQREILILLQSSPSVTVNTVNKK